VEKFTYYSGFLAFVQSDKKKKFLLNL